MRALSILLVVLGGVLMTAPVYGQGNGPRSLLMVYSPYSGLQYGETQQRTFDHTTVGSGTLFNPHDLRPEHTQFGVRHQVSPAWSVTAAVDQRTADDHASVESQLGDRAPRYIVATRWNNIVGLSLEQQGRQHEASVNLWFVTIPVSGHIDERPFIVP